MATAQALLDALTATAELQTVQTGTLREAERVCFLLNLHNLMILHAALAAAMRGNLHADLAASVGDDAESASPRDALRPWRQSIFYQVGDLGTVNAQMVCGFLFEHASGTRASGTCKRTCALRGAQGPLTGRPRPRATRSLSVLDRSATKRESAAVNLTVLVHFGLAWPGPGSPQLAVLTADHFRRRLEAALDDYLAEQVAVDDQNVRRVRCTPHPTHAPGQPAY